ncbi:phage related-protein, partial [Morganella morganii]
MSLTETVFQLIESDVSQTNDALDNLRRSADDIFDDIKNAQQNTLSFGSLLKGMRSQEENISGRHLIEFESNAEEVTGQTRGMSTQLSAMVASLIQYAGGETDEAFRTLKQEHDDLQNSISETRNAGNAAAAAEIDAQKKVQEALGDTGAAWQAAFDKVAALAEKSLNF